MFDKNLLGNNIDDKDKDLIMYAISKIALFFSKFNVEINFDNSSELFQKLNIVEEKDNDKFVVCYNEFTNTLKMNFENPNFSASRFYGELTQSLLDILSKKYNAELKNYDNGLIARDTNGKEHGRTLNERLKEYITTLITGYKKEEKNDEVFYIDSKDSYLTMKDVILHDFIKLYGPEYLLNCFINSNGDEYFFRVGSDLNDESLGATLYDTIDNYRNEDKNNRIISRTIYDSLVSELKEKSLNNSHNL